MSLLVHLPLMGDLRNNGLQNIDFIASTVGSYTNNGKLGKALNLLGSNIRFTISSLLDAKTFSVAFWCRINSNDSIESNWCDVLSFGCVKFDGSSSGNYRFESSYINTYYLSQHNNTGEAISSSVGVLLSERDVWHHVVAVADYASETVLYYIDGVFFKSAAHNGGKLTGVVLIGGENIDPDVDLNDLRIYDHALSPREVTELSKGLVAHWKLDDFVGNPNQLKSNLLLYTPTAYNAYRFDMTENLVANQTYTLQLWDVDISHSEKTAEQLSVNVYWGGGSVFLFRWYVPSGHSNYLAQTFTVTETQASHSTAVNPYLNLYNSTTYVAGTMNMRVGKWKLEKGEVATSWIPSSADDMYSDWGLDEIYDSSGYGHDGTLSPDPPIYDADSARYSGSTRFDGVNNYIEIQDLECMPAILEKAWTVSFWVWNNDDGNRSVIFSNFGLGGVGGFSFGIEKATNNYIRIAYVNGTFDKLIASIMDVQMWAHFAVTKTEDHLVTVYKNGVQVGQYTNENCHSSGTIYRIGGDSRSDSTRFNGKLSDIRIYATALSAEDIKELYSTSASIDNFHNMYAREFVEV